MPQRVLDEALERKGLVGREVGFSHWFTLTQERIVADLDNESGAS